MAYLNLLRPHQWSKNLLCFAGLLFGGKLFQINAVLLSSFVFFVFSLASSSVYIFNDIIDRERDRQHQKKRHRPIASGKISGIVAGTLGAIIGIASFIGAYLLNPVVFAIVILYVINNIFYSFKLKHVPIIDVLSISFGFVLRLLSGIYILGEQPTAWIVLCTMFLALFLGFSKRRAEYISAGNWSFEEVEQRPVLKRYNHLFLDSMVNDTALASVITYALFTTSSGKNPTLISTVPIVYYAIMHYKHMLMMHNRGEEPDLILLKDWKIWLSIIVWVLAFILIYYYDINLFV